MRQMWPQTYRFLKEVFDHFIKDGCMYRAAALTYTTLLSLVPLMTVSFAILSAFPMFERLSGRIQDFIFSHFVATSGEVIQSYLQKFVAQTANLSVIGMAFLVVSAILMIFNMERAFNAIWYVQKRRKGISAFMLYWAVLTLSPVLLGLSVVVSTYVASLPFISSAAHHLGLHDLAIHSTPFVLTALTFTLIYVAVPNCKVPLRYGFAGALVAAILFEAAKFGFGFYVKNVPTYTMLYGALATIPLFLIWLYTLWLIILFGAIISRVLTVGYEYHSVIKMDGFTHAYRWLGYFWLALQQGHGLSLQQLLSKDRCNYEVPPEKQLAILEKNHLIHYAGNGRYILSQDLSNLSFSEFAGLMPWRLPLVQELKQWKGSWEQRLLKLIEHNEMERKKIFASNLASIYHERKNNNVTSFEELNKNGEKLK